MNIERLLLQEFRSYRDLELRLPAAGVRLVGANASGKSSLVEAIGMLATTRSPRTSTEREVINWASGEEIGFPPFARMLTDVVRATGNVQIEIGLQVEGGTTKSVKKQIKLNGRAVRGMDAVGALKAVLFSPEDVAMVAGPPSGRRRFLDVAISQIDGFYLRALSQLARLLSQRNSLLKTLGRDNLTVGSPRVDAQLDFWDRELSAIGAAIMARRQQTVARLDILAQQRFAALSGQDGFRVTYVPSFTLDALVGRPSSQSQHIEEIEAIIRREFEQSLVGARADELRRGSTLVGPHREDIALALNGVDLAVFGSRGQQRIAVIALKLAEVDLMTELGGEAPVLLLDDVLSELDRDHRDLLVESAVGTQTQLLVTTTDRDLVDVPSLAALPLALVVAGQITPI